MRILPDFLFFDMRNSVTDKEMIVEIHEVKKLYDNGLRIACATGGIDNINEQFNAIARRLVAKHLRISPSDLVTRRNQDNNIEVTRKLK